MTLTVKIAGEEDKELWNNLVEKSPYGTIFHTWEFLRVMERYTSKKIGGSRYKGILYPLIAFRGSTPLGILPIYLYNHRFIKFALSPPIRVECLYLGPILPNYETLKNSKRESTLLKFQEEMDKFIFRKFKPNYTSLHLPLGMLDSRPFKWTGYEVEPRHTYILDLSEGLEDIWKGFHKELRRSISKSAKSGLIVENGFQEELEYIHKSLSKRRHEQGKGMTSSVEYLQEIFNSFRDNLKILVAKKDEEYTGGIINLSYKDKLVFWIGAPKVSTSSNSNELLLWESIKLAKEQGFRYYEILGADHPSLYTFKTKFNSNLVTFLSCKKYSPESIKLLAVLYRTIKISH